MATVVDSYIDRVNIAKTWLNKAIEDCSFHHLVVLGSGLGGTLSSWEIKCRFAYHDIPGFPTSSVDGHDNELLVARPPGAKHFSLVMVGRFHCYEGFTAQEVTIPVRVAASLGVKHALITCAAGGISSHLLPGHLMALDDHINGTGLSPLMGSNNTSWGPRFLDQTCVYDRHMLVRLTALANHCGIVLHQGVYVWVLGPEYETPAEVRRWARAGADAVGMSTVPEAMVARHHGMSVTGIALIVNKAAGLSVDGRAGVLTHEEVVKSAQGGAQAMGTLITKLVEGI